MTVDESPTYTGETTSDPAKTVEGIQVLNVEVESQAQTMAKSWKTEEEHVVPKNNLPLVFSSLLLTSFLVRLRFNFWYRS